MTLQSAQFIEGTQPVEELEPNLDWYDDGIKRFVRKAITGLSADVGSVDDIIWLAKSIALARPQDWLSGEESTRFKELKLEHRKPWVVRVPLETKHLYLEEAIRRRCHPERQLFNTSLEALIPMLRSAAFDRSRVRPDSPFVTAVKRSINNRLKRLLKRVDLECNDPDLLFSIHSEALEGLIQDVAETANKAEEKQSWIRALRNALAVGWPDCPDQLKDKLLDLPLRHDEFDIEHLRRRLAPGQELTVVVARFVELERKRHDRECLQMARHSRSTYWADGAIRRQWREIEDFWKNKNNRKLVRENIRRQIAAFHQQIDIDDVESKTMTRLYGRIKNRDRMLRGPLKIDDLVQYIRTISYNVIASWNRKPEPKVRPLDQKQDAQQNSASTGHDFELSDKMRETLRAFQRRRHGASLTLSYALSQLSKDRESLIAANTRGACQRLLDLTIVCIEVLSRWIANDNEDTINAAIVLASPDQLERAEAQGNHALKLKDLVNVAKGEINPHWKDKYENRLPRSGERGPGAWRPTGRQVTENTDYQTLHRDTFGWGGSEDHHPSAYGDIPVGCIIDEGVCGLLRLLFPINCNPSTDLID